MSPAHEAMLWEPAGTEEDDVVQCKLCAHRCRIAAGQVGYCRVRRNDAGTLRTLSFGKVIALNVDPIEKKPLFHVLPGSKSLSVATPGCNFRCRFCQNWQISQAPADESDLDSRAKNISPKELVALAKRYGCASISYTYTEPTIFFELAYETARLARLEELANCFVSNGYMTPEAVATIAPLLDAINVDLKAFREVTYHKVMGASLQPVKDCLVELVRAGVWVEVTTLVVPDMNDSREELADIASFIAEELGPDVPWHVSRFHGDYEMPDGRPTPLETLQTACELGHQAGLKHVYCGNVHGLADESTHCPACGETVLERTGFVVQANRLRDGACGACGQAIPGRWG